MRQPVLLAAILALGTTFLAPARPASAQDLIFTLSSDRVRIASDFRGVTLVAFGAIERDLAPSQPARPYDIVLVMRGPSETLITRRKDRLAGIWVNRDSRTFYSLPSFYSVSSSRPLAEIADAATLGRYGIGTDNLGLAPVGGADDGGGTFRTALVRLKSKAGLFSEAPDGVTFPGATVFKADLAVPANVPIGDYTVTAYLFRAGAMLTSENIAVRVSKEGFERFTFDLAHRHGFLYGLLCVVLALATGWLAGVIFRRD